MEVPCLLCGLPYDGRQGLSQVALYLLSVFMSHWWLSCFPDWRPRCAQDLLRSRTMDATLCAGALTATALDLGSSRVFLLAEVKADVT